MKQLTVALPFRITQLTRRLHVTTDDGMELEILVTEQGVKINRNDGGALIIVPSNSNSIELRKG